METRILETSEWGLVAPVVRGEFQNAMPRHPAQASFLAAFDGAKLAGFLHLEELLHFNCVYAAPEYRRGGVALRLMAEAVSLIPAGFSGVWLTERGASRIARRLGAREVGTYRVYRKDA